VQTDEETTTVVTGCLSSECSNFDCAGCGPNPPRPGQARLSSFASLLPPTLLAGPPKRAAENVRSVSLDEFEVHPNRAPPSKSNDPDDMDTAKPAPPSPRHLTPTPSTPSPALADASASSEQLRGLDPRHLRLQREHSWCSHASQESDTASRMSDMKEEGSELSATGHRKKKSGVSKIRRACSYCHHKKGASPP
jgi:hypothetical protein